MREDVVAYIETLEDGTPIKNYALRVLKHLDGGLKNMPSPSQAIQPDGGEVRERIKGEWAKTPDPGPLKVEWPRPERFSATFLEKAENCLLGAAMSRTLDSAGKPATLGHITHEVLKAIGEAVYAEGLTTVRPETAQKLAAVHMGRMDGYPLSNEHYKLVLEFVGNWALLDTFWPDAELFLMEELFTRTVGEHTYSGIIDRIEVKGGTCRITDYKTGMRAPSPEVFRKRIQTPMYGWLADGFFDGIGLFEVRELYLRSGIVREASFSMDELQIDGYLKTAGDRLVRVFERQEWSKRAGTVHPGEHCDNCAFPLFCPESGHNPYAMVTTMAEAEDVLGHLKATEAAAAQMKKMLRGFTEREQEVVKVGGSEAGYFAKSGFENWDKDAVAAYIAEHGDSPEEFFTVVEGSTEFKVRKEKAE
jgi:RecB family exonuclease